MAFRDGKQLGSFSGSPQKNRGYESELAAWRLARVPEPISRATHICFALPQTSSASHWSPPGRTGTRLESPYRG